MDAIDSNWIAPAGQDLARFERAVASASDHTDAMARSRGTATLHLALLNAGVGPGDDVLCSTWIHSDYAKSNVGLCVAGSSTDL